MAVFIWKNLCARVVVLIVNNLTHHRHSGLKNKSLECKGNLNIVFYQKLLLLSIHPLIVKTCGRNTHNRLDDSWQKLHSVFAVSQALTTGHVQRFPVVSSHGANTFTYLDPTYDVLTNIPCTTYSHVMSVRLAVNSKSTGVTYWFYIFVIAFLDIITLGSSSLSGLTWGNMPNV